jgi:hypothetical protein
MRLSVIKYVDGLYDQMQATIFRSQHNSSMLLDEQGYVHEKL